MSTPPSDSLGSARQTFADQFEQDGTTFIYRRSQKGEAFRISSEARDRFLEEFDRNLVRANWIMYVGMAMVVAAIILFSVVRNSDLSQLAIFAGIGLVLIPYLAYYRWAWAAPARELAGRTPIAGERSPDEVRRLRFQRMTYGQLAGAAFGGLVFPFISRSHQDPFSGWNRLWLVFGGAIVLLAAVQAFRKWRFEQEDSLRNFIPAAPNRGFAQTPDDPSSRTKGQLWRYLPLAVLLLGLAFVAFTPAGKQVAHSPSFLPILMIGLGGWSLFTVWQGFAKGQIEPFIRGFYNAYQREAQPKRFWASMTWNTILGCFSLWIAFTMSRDATAQPLQDRCYDKSRAYSPQEALSACGELVKLQPKDANAYLNRGVAYLDSFKFDQAIPDFTEAHELDPKSAWPLADRGMAYSWKNDRARAERDFEVVKKIDPANPTVLHGEAMLSMNAGDLETAIGKLTTALKVNPGDTWSLQTRADAYQQRGDFAQARADRDQLKQLTSNAQAPPSDQ